MNMDACLPGHIAAEATAATGGGNTKREEEETREGERVDHSRERETVRVG